MSEPRKINSADDPMKMFLRVFHGVVMDGMEKETVFRAKGLVRRPPRSSTRMWEIIEYATWRSAYSDTHKSNAYWLGIAVRCWRALDYAEPDRFRYNLETTK